MADRSSARAFGLFMSILADALEFKTDPKDMAMRLLKEARYCDFDLCQMNCDAALLALGVAKKDPDGMVLYLGEDYK